MSRRSWHAEEAGNVFPYGNVMMGPNCLPRTLSSSSGLRVTSGPGPPGPGFAAAAADVGASLCFGGGARRCSGAGLNAMASNREEAGNRFLGEARLQSWGIPPLVRHMLWPLGRVKQEEEAGDLEGELELGRTRMEAAMPGGEHAAGNSVPSSSLEKRGEDCGGQRQPAEAFRVQPISVATAPGHGELAGGKGGSWAVEEVKVELEGAGLGLPEVAMGGQDEPVCDLRVAQAGLWDVGFGGNPERPQEAVVPLVPEVMGDLKEKELVVEAGRKEGEVGCSAAQRLRRSPSGVGMPTTQEGSQLPVSQSRELAVTTVEERIQDWLGRCSVGREEKSWFPHPGMGGKGLHACYGGQGESELVGSRSWAVAEGNGSVSGMSGNSSGTGSEQGPVLQGSLTLGPVEGLLQGCDDVKQLEQLEREESAMFAGAAAEPGEERVVKQKFMQAGGTGQEAGDVVPMGATNSGEECCSRPADKDVPCLVTVERIVEVQGEGDKWIPLQTFTREYVTSSNGGSQEEMNSESILGYFPLVTNVPLRKQKKGRVTNGKKGGKKLDSVPGPVLARENRGRAGHGVQYVGRPVTAEEVANPNFSPAALELVRSVAAPADAPGCAATFPGQTGVPTLGTQQHLCTLCRNPEKEDSLLCDKCHNSFHLDCLGMDPKIAILEEEWLCPSCKRDGGTWSWQLRKIAVGAPADEAQQHRLRSATRQTGHERLKRFEALEQQSPGTHGTTMNLRSRTTQGRGQSPVEDPFRLEEPYSRNKFAPRFSVETVRKYEVQAMDKLRVYIEDKGGVLPQGWVGRCMMVKHKTALQAYYVSPKGRRFQSKVQVAEHMGLVSFKTKQADYSPELSQPEQREMKIEAEAVENLRRFIASKKGKLGPGWTAQVVPKKHIHGRMHICYVSPDKLYFRTKSKVAQYLGLMDEAGDDEHFTEPDQAAPKWAPHQQVASTDLSEHQEHRDQFFSSEGMRTNEQEEQEGMFGDPNFPGEPSANRAMSELQLNPDASVGRAVAGSSGVRTSSQHQWFNIVPCVEITASQELPSAVLTVSVQTEGYQDTSFKDKDGRQEEPFILGSNLGLKDFSIGNGVPSTPQIPSIISSAPERYGAAEIRRRVDASLLRCTNDQDYGVPKSPDATLSSGHKPHRASAAAGPNISNNLTPDKLAYHRSDEVAPAGNNVVPTVAPAGKNAAPTVAPAGKNAAPTVAPAGSNAAPTVAPAGNNAGPTETIASPRIQPEGRNLPVPEAEENSTGSKMVALTMEKNPTQSAEAGECRDANGEKTILQRLQATKRQALLTEMFRPLKRSKLSAPRPVEPSNAVAASNSGSRVGGATTVEVGSTSHGRAFSTSVCQEDPQAVGGWDMDPHMKVCFCTRYVTFPDQPQEPLPDKPATPATPANPDEAVPPVESGKGKGRKKAAKDQELEQPDDTGKEAGKKIPRTRSGDLALVASRQDDDMPRSRKRIKTATAEPEPTGKKSKNNKPAEKEKEKEKEPVPKPGRRRGRPRKVPLPLPPPELLPAQELPKQPKPKQKLKPTPAAEKLSPLPQPTERRRGRPRGVQAAEKARTIPKPLKLQKPQKPARRPLPDSPQDSSEYLEVPSIFTLPAPGVKEEPISDAEADYDATENAYAERTRKERAAAEDAYGRKARRARMESEDEAYAEAEDEAYAEAEDEAYAEAEDEAYAEAEAEADGPWVRDSVDVDDTDYRVWDGQSFPEPEYELGMAGPGYGARRGSSGRKEIRTGYGGIGSRKEVGAAGPHGRARIRKDYKMLDADGWREYEEASVAETGYLPARNKKRLRDPENENGGKSGRRREEEEVEEESGGWETDDESEGEAEAEEVEVVRKRGGGKRGRGRGGRGPPKMPAAEPLQQAILARKRDEAMHQLNGFILELGGRLERGWKAKATLRARRKPGSKSMDIHFVSSNGQLFRSKFEVARHLGLLRDRASQGYSP